MHSTWIVLLIYKGLIEHCNYQLEKPGQITGLRAGGEDEFRFLNLGV